MKRSWSYLVNPFLVATDNSFRMAVRISTYHDSALNAASADPFIAGLYATFHPLHKDLANAYTAYQAQTGTQEGDSLNLRQLFRLEAYSKINAWEAAIQVVYAKDTPKFKSLLPNGHAPFQTGTQTQRISAVQSLSNAIGADPLLAAVKADVDAFYLLLDNANTTQKGSKSTTGTLSDEVENARYKMCIAQYANLGALIQQYADATSPIEQYFDEQAIRNAQQVLFEGNVKQNDVHTIVKHTFAAYDQLKLENPGVTGLKFYLAAVKGAHAGAVAVTLAAGTQQTVAASALGDVANPYLMASNADLINKGKFTVEML